MDKEIEMMLPEYVNGTLKPEDAKRIEQIMDKEIDIKSEIEFLESLRAVVKSEHIESPAEWGLARLKRSIAKTEPAKPVASSWWKPIAVAASFAFVLQTSYMLFNENKIDEGYVPLSTSELENTIQVVFNPATTEAQLRSLLTEANATIVSGPSASGVYRISTNDIESAIELLKVSKLVEHVEKE